MQSCCHAVTQSHTHNADMLSHRRRPRRRAASRSRATTTGWVQPAVIAVIKHSSIIHSCPVAGRDHRAAPADQAAAQRGHQRTPAAGRRPDGACERDQGAAGALQGKMRTVVSCLVPSQLTLCCPCPMQCCRGMLILGKKTACHHPVCPFCDSPVCPAPDCGVKSKTEWIKFYRK